MVLWGKRAVGFFHSALQHTNGKLTGVHRRWDLANKMAEGANMVQVPVGKHMPADFVLVFEQVADIWCDVINTWVVATREQKAHIHHDNFVIILYGHHVLANAHFAQATNRDHAELRALGFWLALPFCHAKLAAFVAIINRFIDWDINRVLASPGIHALRYPPLRAKNLAFTRRRVVQCRNV